jgi:DHA2 family multidrug resistance protein
MNEQVKTSPFFILSIFLTLFLAVFYNAVTNMAGLYIISELGGSRELSVYTMVFFGLGSAVSMPLANPMADRLGSVKVVVYGLLGYTFFSILCALAPTFFMFNLFRFGLGVGSGLFFILCRRLLLEFAPKESIQTYFFLMVLMYVTIPVLGACFGAWIAYESHWRWIFHVNEPISLALAAYFWIFYRKASGQVPFAPFDKVGYFFFVLGIVSLVTAATLSQQLDWYRSTTIVTLSLIGVPSFLFFILWELNCRHPMLELKLLKSIALSFALINLAVLFSAYFGMIILVTLWLNIYANYTPLWIAALIGIMAISGLTAYFLTKSLLRHYDLRVTLALAILAFATSCYYSTYFNIDTDFFHIAVARFLAGLGFVLFLFPVFGLALKSYGPEKSASVFTLLQVVRALFSSLGAGLYVILWQRRQAFFHERLGESLTINSQLTEQYFNRAIKRFSLTKDQATEQLNNYLGEQATSLGLNDSFGCMGYILMALFVLLLLSYLFEKILGRKLINN